MERVVDVHPPREQISVRMHRLQNVVAAGLGGYGEVHHGGRAAPQSCQRQIFRARGGSVSPDAIPVGKSHVGVGLDAARNHHLTSCVNDFGSLAAEGSRHYHSDYLFALDGHVPLAHAGRGNHLSALNEHV